jgi:hypothetical protein
LAEIIHFRLDVSFRQACATEKISGAAGETPPFSWSMPQFRGEYRYEKSAFSKRNCFTFGLCVSGPVKMYDLWHFENVSVNSLQDALQDWAGMADGGTRQ